MQFSQLLKQLQVLINLNPIRIVEIMEYKNFQNIIKLYLNSEILARLTFTSDLLFSVEFAGVGHREYG